MEYSDNMTNGQRSEYVGENFAKAFPETTPGKLRLEMGLPPLGTRRTNKELARAIAEKLGETERI